MLADEFLKLIKKGRLYPPVYNIALFTPPLSGYYLKKFYRDKLPFPYLVAMQAGQPSLVFIPQTKIENLARRVFRRYWRQPSFLMRARREFLIQPLKVLTGIYLKWNYAHIRTQPTRKLVKLVKHIIFLCRQINTLMWASLFEEDFIYLMLKELNLKDLTLSFPNISPLAKKLAYPSFRQRQELYLLELIRRRVKWPEISERCQYFFADYNYIKDRQQVSQILQRKYGNLSVREAARLIKKTREELSLSLSKYKRQLRNLSKNEQKLVNFIQQMIRLRDVRKVGIIKALTIVYRIAERVFEEVGLAHELIRYCSAAEFMKDAKYFAGKRSEIEERPKGITVLYRVDLFTEPLFEVNTYQATTVKLINYYRKQEKFRGGLIQLKGQTAYPGKVQGLIKIVADTQRLADWPKGCILVASMTRPEFVPFIKKAAAIVTNEGGVACHAAIISRELRVPCIMGTKIATQVLKDGDVVEVDAGKGVVRVLKRAN